MIRVFSIFFLILACGSIKAQQEVRFSLTMGAYGYKNCPISIDLSNYALPWQDTTYELYRLEGNQRTPIAAQVVPGLHTSLHFILAGNLPPGKSIQFILAPAPPSKWPSPLSISKESSGYLFSREDKPLLKYQADMTYPPEGVDGIFARSGYIHPLWSPSGTILTRIQPPDHYHHYGLWGPWTETSIEGRKVDFWNLYKGEGTVRFAKLRHAIAGPVFASLSVLQEHVNFGAKGPDQTALNEVLEVCAWNADPEGKYWLLDYTSTFTCPLDSGILFEAYRYGGGLGFRALEAWTKDNSAVLTSAGHTRKTADGTAARWCMLTGPLNTGKGGILFMDHPTNRVHPQPMRVWPEDANEGRGDLFFEFCPIRHQAWPILKNTAYAQRYRMLVFEGTLSAEEAERHWQAFAHPPKVSFH